jgi:hypothetical protein
MSRGWERQRVKIIHSFKELRIFTASVIRAIHWMYLTLLLQTFPQKRRNITNEDPALLTWVWGSGFSRRRVWRWQSSGIPWSLVVAVWRFRGAYCLHHQGDSSPDDEGSKYLWIVYYNETRERNIPEVCHIHSLASFGRSVSQYSALK